MYVKVVPYQPAWPAEYEAEAEKIKQILGGELIEIHHIGSTSVPGLKAKPILDILPVVRDIDRIDAYNSAFEAIGYEAMGELGLPGRRYFRKGGDHRTHQVHIFAESSAHEIQRHLALRNYLRAHPGDAYAYGELKQSLAVRFPKDIEGYCNGKDAFVKELEQKALKWEQGGCFVTEHLE